MCSTDCFLAFLAILFPPIAVWVKRGICSADSIINIALCMLGFLPGLLHAWYIIAKYPEDSLYLPLDNSEAGIRRYQHVYYFPTATTATPPHHATSPTSQQQPGYSTFSCNHHHQASQQRIPTPQPVPHQGPMTPTRYTHYPQQTDDGAAGPVNSGPVGDNGLPSYAEVVKGDHKIQTHD